MAVSASGDRACSRPTACHFVPHQRLHTCSSGALLRPADKQANQPSPGTDLRCGKAKVVVDELDGRAERQRFLQTLLKQPLLLHPRQHPAQHFVVNVGGDELHHCC